MKKTITFYLLLVTFCSYSQAEGRFGVSLGATNYITDTNLLFSKSGIGYTIGVSGSAEFSDQSQLFVEVNYNNHFVKFIGRENETATPKDIKFKLQNISVTPVFNYNYFMYDEFKFGVNAGPSFTFIYQYLLVDNAKENYVLDPLYASPRWLEFDTQNDQLSFNLFLAAGLSVQYDFLMANLRYYYGITDPYISIPLDSAIEIKGKDSYFTFSVTCFLL